jgi:nucleotide-binding universal stress UspA family protein
MMEIERILVPIDFSAPSLKALDAAVEFGRPYNAELIVMFAVERGFYESPLFVPDSGAILEHQGQAAQDRLEDVCSDVRARGINCRKIIEVGVAYKAIVDTAKRIKASLIVISTHGRSGLAHVLIGSVAERVVQHSECPVLTLRTLGHVADN